MADLQRLMMPYNILIKTSMFEFYFAFHDMHRHGPTINQWEFRALCHEELSRAETMLKHGEAKEEWCWCSEVEL